MFQRKEETEERKKKEDRIAVQVSDQVRDRRHAGSTLELH
jgi:hypothetical protein